ncbi:hypothetical protein HAP47_0021755 [Bradyrhizobium sp. 41S5]|uniref:hypothetical protein n=1 Tax=Bradyrhizobium sp. 41S5 TaxID=1404443 RepID=UPI00156BB4AA|nr:hypothetical protein [Bradyrhizobium sp. 41S5]UFX41925.1 hypothetical protein HAP47_0021755 [Bradyrhizobium sp. 41S5]
MSTEEGKWKEAYAAVGELVLLYAGLDHQLNHIIIEVAQLVRSPMLEAVVATLDPRQKIELLKARADHIRQQDWRKALKAHADRLERVARVRNTVAHVPIVPNKTTGNLEFAATAATKLLKSLKFQSKDDYTVDRMGLHRVREAIDLGNKTLGGGQEILANFSNLRAALAAKSSARGTDEAG